MHLFINGCGASAGGGITYLRNVLPHLASRSDVGVTVLVSQEAADAFRVPAGIRWLPLPGGRFGAAGRFLREQRLVPRLIRACGADVLLSTGNFAILRSPVPQVLLSRNALYTSAEFSRDLLRRGGYGMWAGTKIRGCLARYSIRHAECTVAPSEAFAQELRAWTGRGIRVVHHGFDRSQFAEAGSLSPELEASLKRPPDTLRILFVSHYNYYRNFETLLRAVPLIRQRLGKRVQVLLTCKLEGTPGSYDTREAAALVGKLGIARDVVQLGAVPYGQLHRLYQSCDVYVSPAYAETFAHPMVEAMSCGVPVVASELAVHREICRDAALYFPTFSPEGLADRVAQLALSETLSDALSKRGLARAREFSWKLHVEEILAISRELAGAGAQHEYSGEVADVLVSHAEEQVQHKAG